MKQYLIADSGGTKTDWCLIDSVGQKSFFSSESCHPVNWDKTFFVRLNELLSKVPTIGKTELYFFGSGCYNRDNRTKLKLELSK